MNREIKFRVWCEYEIDGVLHKSMENEASWFVLTQNGVLLTYGPMSPLQDCSDYKNVVPLFYTGLHDDKGTPIYEGDVIRGTYVVIFENGSFFVHDKKFNEKTLLRDVTGIIIGNIYENPELLEAQNENNSV